jgi:LuxR family transcriptional regulator, maltose regulon positive regulatory protein
MFNCQIEESKMASTQADHSNHNNDQFLLATKLSIPLVRKALVSRPRLIQALQTGTEHPFTLVAAPAGFGKTLLLSTWARQCEKPIAWVSLDSSDNDQAQFWAYIITAFDTFSPGIGKTALSMLHSSQPIPVATVLVALLNSLGALPHDFVLVLDDYHVIDVLAIHNSITFLLDHLPPQMHLVLASRVDPLLPLSRLRTRHQLTELRADDLRFTADEAATFLREAMGLSLKPEEIEALDTRTEGWIAGLQLAALSLQGRKDIPAFISVFAGSNRYIVDYLTEEVLHQQPEEVRTFLLQTSILDLLSGSLCNAVTQQTSGQAMLERLEQANLFLVPLDEQRHWYRYHHLFAETLRYRLSVEHADSVSELHRRASDWFERNSVLLKIRDLGLPLLGVTRTAPGLNEVFKRLS